METAYVPVNGFVYREDVPAAALLFLLLSLFNLPPRSISPRPRLPSRFARVPRI